MNESKYIQPMYHVYGLCPRTDIDMGRCGFGIKLWPSWRDAVAEVGLTQENIQNALKSYNRQWLDGCGFGRMYDPDKRPFDKDERLGPNARPLYDIHSIHLTWGEWGPEHITVPGNACGLDISKGICAPINGRVLEPHNIDSFGQVMLLLTIFTTFADHIISELEYRQLKIK